MKNEIQLLHGDCLERLKELPDNSVDSVVTDPPYGLSFMGKKWDYDVPSVEVWAECLRVLKPGGHLLAFAGTRTQHRMAVRIEDAGFEIRDMIAWVYGSGFPKSHNLKDDWQGWGTALKPALEPITVARKPFCGTVAANVLTHGTGGINVDGCRVAPNGESLNGGSTVGSHGRHEGWRRPWMDNPEHNARAAERAKERVARAETQGRWPANLIHDGSDEVVELFPNTKSGKLKSDQYITPSGNNESMFAGGGAYENKGYEADHGSAARFFYCAKASKRDRDEGCEGFDLDSRRMFASGGRTMRDGEWVETDSEPKPRKNNHPTVKPTALMRYLCRLVTPPHGIVLDPFMGSGSTGKAAMLEGFQFIGIEREADYMEIAKARIDAAKTLI